ncbi:hypothetical protein BaRGS_00012837 [Batillaria attramentaria]|uniref:protein acetyllysine N-acetyltransferase n=1 Tax=Batillaria attramentaria TaxID=370345 RepID=A0ABD0L903_9CAEN
MKCHYRRCKLAPLSETDARIEIKAVLPAGWVQSDANKTAAVVEWKRNGEACFHKPCWDTVLSTARARRAVKNGPAMKQSEKLMVRQAAETAEAFDSAQEVEDAAKVVADLIRTSSHCIAFTGAGISTSAGLGDFRGKSGKWTEEDQIRANDSISAAFHAEAATSSSDVTDGTTDPPVKRRRSAEKGCLHYIISQNCDGLHLLSGVPSDKLSELHGDVFVEKCETCGKRYSRDYYVLDDVSSQYYEELANYKHTDIKKPKHAVKCSLCGLSHRTGRMCEEKACCGYLMDTIINFRDNLEEEILDRARAEAGQSDLILCLGTTLTVTPAADLVDMAKGKQPLVICNRQETEKEKAAKVRVFGDCDKFLKLVIRHLLPDYEWKEWEGSRQERMEKYQQQRTMGASHQ